MDQPDDVENPIDSLAKAKAATEIGGQPSNTEEDTGLGENEDFTDTVDSQNRVESVPSMQPVSSNMDDITEVMRRLKSGQSDTSEQEDLPPSTLEDPTASIDTRKAALAQLRKKYLNIG